MALSEGKGSGDELVDHGVVEDLFAEDEEFVDSTALDERERCRRGRGHVLEVLGAAQDELQLLDAESPDLVAAEVLAPCEAEGDVKDARAAHDGVVDVEEGRRGTGYVLSDRFVGCGG